MHAMLDSLVQLGIALMITDIGISPSHRVASMMCGNCGRRTDQHGHENENDTRLTTTTSW